MREKDAKFTGGGEKNHNNEQFCSEKQNFSTSLVFLCFFVVVSSERNSAVKGNEFTSRREKKRETEEEGEKEGKRC